MRHDGMAAVERRETPGRRAPWGVIALAGRAQRGQCLDPGGVKRRPVIQRDEDPVAQRQPQPPRHAVTDRRVRRVLRELNDDPVTVPAERVVLLRVRVLPEPAR